MKYTIKKTKNYNFGGGVIRDTYFVKVWDNYGDLTHVVIGGFTKEEAMETKNNLKTKMF
jgi:hypothetical protein